jgi:hypothetical protein
MKITRAMIIINMILSFGASIAPLKEPHIIKEESWTSQQHPCLLQDRWASDED